MNLAYALIGIALALSYYIGRLVWKRIGDTDIYYYNVLFCGGATVLLTFALVAFAISEGSVFSFGGFLWINVLQAGVSISLLAFMHFKVGWKEIWKLVAKDRRYILYATLFFSLGLALGLTVQDQVYELANQQLEDIEEISELSVDKPAWEITAFIFGNNTKTAILLGVALPLIPLIGGVYVIFSMFLNGAVVGVVGAIIDKPFHYFLVGIVPHGIFEIPAILLAAAVGLKLNSRIIFGFLAAFTERERNASEVFTEYLQEGIESWKIMYLVIFLLIIAAIIESTLTPALLSHIS